MKKKDTLFLVGSISATFLIILVAFVFIAISSAKKKKKTKEGGKYSYATTEKAVETEEKKRDKRDNTNKEKSEKKVSTDNELKQTLESVSKILNSAESEVGEGEKQQKHYAEEKVEKKAGNKEGNKTVVASGVSVRKVSYNSSEKVAVKKEKGDETETGTEYSYSYSYTYKKDERKKQSFKQSLRAVSELKTVQKVGSYELYPGDLIVNWAKIGKGH